ncbi:MAG: cysteine desulfurase NifS [Thermoproteota archaeon]
MKRIYMDHSATTPVDPKVVEAMSPYFSEKFGNASSLHSFGREAFEAMQESRKKIASLIGADPEEIVFTSGGTESDNLALVGSVRMMKQKGKDHIITSKIEHPAVLETCRNLEEEGFKVTYLDVDRDGLISPEDVRRAITEKTALITVMHANNEIGTIEPIEEIAEIASEKGVRFHTDAVQSVGKIPIDVGKMKVDLLSMSAHKIYGPKGVGALYVAKGITLKPLVYGGGHERGIRSGTENVAGIVGMGVAAELAKVRLEEDSKLLVMLRDKLIENVTQRISESYLNGHTKKRLPNNAHFRFTGIEGESLILELDDKGIAASTGSACSSKKLEPSHVLLAIGLNEVEAHSSLRLTLGRENTEEDIEYVVECLEIAVGKLRAISSLWKKTFELERWKRQLQAKKH